MVFSRVTLSVTHFVSKLLGSLTARLVDRVCLWLVFWHTEMLLKQSLLLAARHTCKPAPFPDAVAKMNRAFCYTQRTSWRADVPCGNILAAHKRHLLAWCLPSAGRSTTCLGVIQTQGKLVNATIIPTDGHNFELIRGCIFDTVARSSMPNWVSQKGLSVLSFPASS